MQCVLIVSQVLLIAPNSGDLPEVPDPNPTDLGQNEPVTNLTAPLNIIAKIIEQISSFACVMDQPFNLSIIKSFFPVL